MHKPIVLIIATILGTCPLYGYTITIQEKLIGILNKSTVIKNIKSIEVANNYVHVEIKEKGNVYPYSFACSSVVRITEDNGNNIPFNCDDFKGDESMKIGVSSMQRDQNIDTKEIDLDNHSTKSSRLQNKIIDLANLYGNDLTERNIKVEGDVVIIEINSRRTNVQSTLIKTYWLCGHAMHQNNLFFSEIRVIVNIQKKEKEKLITAANGRDVISIGQYKKPVQSALNKFLKKIDVYRQM